jgi:O-acetylhomoserine/O-acetylserine sulfhydrylase
MEWSDRI